MSWRKLNGHFSIWITSDIHVYSPFLQWFLFDVAGLFNSNLREAIKKWESSDEVYKQHADQEGIREAIKFFKNQPGGEKYWKDIKENESVCGFNWLRHQNHKINK